MPESDTLLAYLVSSFPGAVGVLRSIFCTRQNGLADSRA